jgi:hypothetical protein
MFLSSLLYTNVNITIAHFFNIKIQSIYQFSILLLIIYQLLTSLLHNTLKSQQIQIKKCPWNILEFETNPLCYHTQVLIHIYLPSLYILLYIMLYLADLYLVFILLRKKITIKLILNKFSICYSIFFVYINKNNYVRLFIFFILSVYLYFHETMSLLIIKIYITALRRRCFNRYGWHWDIIGSMLASEPNPAAGYMT